MQTVIFVGVLLISYLLGSIPFGLVFVWLKTRQDLRTIESGRTGGTNAMRAAGIWAFVFTGLMDLLKSAAAVWLSMWLAPTNVWLHVLAPTVAIIGHNYSIFLSGRDATGKFRWRGGAGGAPAAGGAFGLWPPSILIVVPVAMFILFVVGYASVATMSIAAMIIVVFAYRAWIGAAPWEYVVYGILAEILLVWSLRPNIRRLLNGTERLVGLRARRRNQSGDEDHSSSSSSSSS
jgi:acyl phosphate:glycerol-3-phosphate acyltransferase